MFIPKIPDNDLKPYIEELVYIVERFYAETDEEELPSTDGAGRTGLEGNGMGMLCVSSADGWDDIVCPFRSFTVCADD